ncbi:protein Fe65 homolog isoform X2 [Limulus polyphemus]|uniref:Protein Fe65 homolog isoform X2 n=1 Tax=Limulus polyphemus TaxID=6850 RepID=A0ABM1T5U3_LIMPO|nr:protein Fe65 homolog isoform X2 [Limulus polyphemus]
MVRLDNEVLSFPNPNYHLNPADINSNPEPTFNPIGLDERLFEKWDAVRNSGEAKNGESLDINLNSTFGQTETVMANPDRDNNMCNTADTTQTCSESDINSPMRKDSNDNTTTKERNGLLEYYLSLEAAVRQQQEANQKAEEEELKKNHGNGSVQVTPESLESNHVADQSITTTLQQHHNEANKYVPPVESAVKKDAVSTYLKRQSIPLPEKPSEEQKVSSLESTQKADSPNTCYKDDLLPPGWERHEDESGPYYWHISSGSIQRQPPPPTVPPMVNYTIQSKRSSVGLESVWNPLSSLAASSPPTGKVFEEETISGLTRRQENQLKRRSYPQRLCSLTPDKKPIRFAVRSLGWAEIAEEDLTPEKSSKAVNKCIVDLSLGRNDILDAIGRWGDGKDLYMDLDDYCLRLINPHDLTVLNIQPIQTIRVWGVGRDNGRDFAYVARDRVTRKQMCHVFRCDIPARIIANTLRDLCKKIMLERSYQQNFANLVTHAASKPTMKAERQGIKAVAARPTNLPVEQRRLRHMNSRNVYNSQSFPTPMEEPRKIIKAYYLGTTLVLKPSGMDVINSAISELVVSVPSEAYRYVDVVVSPSTIAIAKIGPDPRLLAECRVRYLTFLGIGQIVKHCAFIMHTADDQFIAYVFHCEPSSGPLCKTIEAACKLRYQKCLDAHREALARKNCEGQQRKGLKSIIRGMFGSLTSSLSRSIES